MAKKQKGKSRKLTPAAQSGASLRSTLIGTMFNMVASTATFGAVLLCRIVAKHLT
jgi:hypothetical protein